MSTEDRDLPGAPDPTEGMPQSEDKSRQKDAGTDESITERLERNPESSDARLDRALDESMDASDPPASTQPVHATTAPESSGYDPEAEAQRAQDES